MPNALRYLWQATGDYYRQAVGLRALALAPANTDPVGRICDQLLHRELRFLELVLRAVFERGENPYFHMFRMAGCSYEDLTEIVLREGLESTLALLREAGVYLTHEEFTGVVPIVRNGREIPARILSFANPLVKAMVAGGWGGGRRRRVIQGAEANAYYEGYDLLARQEFALPGRAHIQLQPLPPSASGLTACVRAARRGWHVDRWFAPDSAEGPDRRQWLGSHFLVSVARAGGVAVPFPTPLPDNDFGPVASWIAARKKEGIATSVSTLTSYAVRVADAALRDGLDISGTIFLAQGEVISPAKRDVMETVGARIYPTYWISEIGPVGFACRDMGPENCVHLFEDSVAAIVHRRKAALTGREVDALLLTTLLPMAPLVLINAETDDAAHIDRASCGCLFRRVGFARRLRDIYSFGRLTAMGASLLSSDIVRLLEWDLPGRFGGRAGDYQLIELEGSAQTEIILRIRPGACSASCDTVKQYVLAGMPRLNSGWIAARIWRHAGAFHVIAADPIASPGGRILPLQLLGAGREAMAEPLA